jgi:sugar/nucleoside kinase (ribokinase family)
MTSASTPRADRWNRAAAIDYLIVGHVTTDLSPDGPRLGGTAAYAGLTAFRLGLRVGLVTACDASLDLSPLEGLAIHRKSASSTTTFENSSQNGIRHQVVRRVAPDLTLADVPEAWRGAPIVHLAPVAGEVDPSLSAAFPDAFIGVTPQGWWRVLDDAGNVSGRETARALDDLVPAHAAVFSRQDLTLGAGDLQVIQRAWPVVVVTDGPAGSHVSWDGEHQHIPAPTTPLVDDTGAGDIFAAVFFAQLASGRAPDGAAQEATRWAASSVRSEGLAGVGNADRALAAGAAGR